MSDRAIVQIDPGSTPTPGGSYCGLDVRLRKTPILRLRNGQPLDGKPKHLMCSLGTAPPEKVNDYGGVLLKSLMDSHTGIKETLESALQVVPPGRRPLYFQITAEEAEVFYWETLYDQESDFLALDRRWQIGRIADDLQPRSALPRAYAPPLRLMLVLSALGFSAAPEWEKVHASVEQARAKGLDVHVRVLAGEGSLVNLISQQAQPGRTEVLPLPTGKAEVERAIEDFKPHLLHFFCHGAADTGNVQLQLATAKDHLTNATRSSVVLTRSGLMNLTATPSIWLLILNCCEGAKASPGMASLTHSLVAGGVAAAIGMLERVNVAAAHEFSERLYPALFAYLHDCLKDGKEGEVIELEWVEALYDARSALRERYGDAAQNRTWALPVLYVSKESFQVQCQLVVNEHKQSYDATVAGYIETQPAYMRPYLRDHFEDILAGRPVPPPPQPTDHV